MIRHQPSISIVVAEAGAEYTSWVDVLRSEGHDVVVLRQRDDETLAEMAARVSARVRGVAELGAQLEKAVICGGNAGAKDTLSARTTTTRALLTAMVPRSRGQLVLSGARHDRFAMLGLASTLAEMVRGSGVSVQPAEAAVPMAA